ncbi:uncharacterized protein YjcR [Paenisporosarcina sp. OV554]|nr:phage terminase small subunit [Paenisporosarcina sp. OV554]PUB12609.1 uncharacterized protein YjcR [Paenisporosarcina sp. OV554]
MARARSPARDTAYEIYKLSEGKKLLKDIATELDVSDSQIRKWKNQDKWDDQMNGNVTNEIGNVTKRNGSLSAPANNDTLDGSKSSKKEVARKKRSGNPKPKNQFSQRNTRSLKHGLFSRYMPQETLDIMGMVEDSEPADLLWIQIQIQYAAIIRAQKIMFVESKDEMIKEIKKVESSELGDKVEYEFQFSWDRQATFLNAQSKAIGELRSSIKQFNEMAHDDDERLLKIEQMRLGIDKTKAEIEKLNGNNDEGPIEIMISRKGGR